jgi:hypothetical protein
MSLSEKRLQPLLQKTFGPHLPSNAFFNCVECLCIPIFRFFDFPDRLLMQNVRTSYGNAAAAESDKERRFPQPLGKVRQKAAELSHISTAPTGDINKNVKDQNHRFEGDNFSNRTTLRQQCGK